MIRRPVLASVNNLSGTSEIMVSVLESVTGGRNLPVGGVFFFLLQTETFLSRDDVTVVSAQHQCDPTDDGGRQDC